MISPDDIPDADDVESVENLLGILTDLAKENQIQRSQLSAQADAIDFLETEVEQLREDLESVNENVELVDATMPDQQKGKMQKIRGILEYATSDATGGPSGVTVETGEATAAAGSSRDTALRLMDDIATNFAWARVDNPGGPNPKKLKLDIRGRSVSDLMDDVQAHYGGGATA